VIGVCLLRVVVRPNFVHPKLHSLAWLVLRYMAARDPVVVRL
jgi:hypothetical protein